MVHPDCIIHWIENLPDPLGPSLKRTGRKRCWDEMSDTTHQTPERPSKIPTPNTSFGSPEADDATPRPAPCTRADIFTSPHPRPSPSSMSSTRAAMFDVPDLRPSRAAASSISPTYSSPTSSRTGSSQSSRFKRRKSESPNKSVGISGRYPVSWRSIQTPGDIPKGAETLAENMRRCHKRDGILHSNTSAEMKPHLYGGDDGVFSDQRACVGESPPYADVVEIVDQANETEVRGKHESAWNCDVHTVLLRTALRHSKWRKEIQCENV